MAESLGQMAPSRQMTNFLGLGGNAAMFGLMQDRPLLIQQLIEHAALNHGDTEIVSRRVEGDIHRYTYRDARRRAKQLAEALLQLGIEPGDRIGTLAWNGYRHFELYYGISGVQGLQNCGRLRSQRDRRLPSSQHPSLRPGCRRALPQPSRTRTGRSASPLQAPATFPPSAPTPRCDRTARCVRCLPAL